MDHSPGTINVLSLCSGAGGLELGLRLALPAARTVCYVERDAFSCAVLEARMRDGTLDAAPVWTDLKSFKGRPWRGIVDVVAAGYPCQPFSTMGKRRAQSDPRHLWPHVARIVGECGPALVLCENVANHLELGFEEVVHDLREMGYGCEAGLFSAAEVGAPHARDRLFFVAYAQGVHARSGELEPLWRESIGGRAGGVDGPGPRGPWEGPEGLYPPPREGGAHWGRICADHPAHKPAFLDRDDELASGLAEPDVANRERQIRVVGNGVCPSAAGYAFGILLSRAVGALPGPGLPG